MKTRNWIILSLLALLGASCQESVEYPVKPQIAYQGLTYLFNADSTFSGQVVVALSSGDISGNGYQAVVNPALLEQGKEGAA